MRQVRLQYLPSDSWSYIAADFCARVYGHRSMMEGFYKAFDYTKNPKQLLVWTTLSDPELPKRCKNRTQHVCLRGSVRSGKSIFSIAYPMMLLHKFSGARWLVMRRTNAQLMASSFTQIIDFCKAFGIPFESRQASAAGPAEIRFPNSSKFVFWSSEAVVETTTADNARGLGSTEYIGATLEEADSIHKEAIDTVPQRLSQPVGVDYFLIFYNINPTPENHWIAKMFRNKEGIEHPEDYHDYHFTMEDNEYWLPPGYKESQYARCKHNPGLYRRFILGLWGPEIRGMPIFGPHFNREFHINKWSFADNWIEKSLWKDGPLCLCWDFGFNHPALVVFQDVQIGSFQQIRILAGWLGDQTTLGVFGRLVLDEVNRLFPFAQIFTYGDKAGKQADPRGVTATDAFDVLRMFGLNPIANYSDEHAGVDLIIDLLRRANNSKTLGVQPEIIIEPRTDLTDDLVNMFEIGFAQPEELGKKDKLKPIDDGYFIHLADALRYGITSRRSLKGRGGGPAPFASGEQRPEEWLPLDMRGMYMSERYKDGDTPEVSTAFYSFG